MSISSKFRDFSSIFDDFSSKFVDFGEISTKKRENLTKNREIANGTLLRALHQMDTVKWTETKQRLVLLSVFWITKYFTLSTKPGYLPL